MKKPVVRAAILMVVLVLCFRQSAPAQDSGLALLLPNLYGPDGLFVDSEAPLPDGSTHSAHFNNAFQASFGPFNTALGTEISALPFPSTASGFSYEFDSTLGVLVRSTESSGPILSERAETLGKGKLAFGMVYQYFTFDTIEDVDLDDVPAVFTHDDPTPGGKADVVTTRTAVDFSIGQAIAFLTYGVTERVDVSVAVPVVSSDLEVRSVATVRRLGTAGNSAVHFFEDGQGGVGDTRLYQAAGDASGLGDIVVRVKGRFWKRSRGGTALGVDVRVPTGEELDFLGAGAVGIRPFVAVSASHRRVFSHLNLAYQWNDDSVLAGDVVSGEKADLPDQWILSAGVESRFGERLSLVVDFIARHSADTARLVRRTFVGLDAGATSFEDISFDEDSSYTSYNSAVGLKLRVRENLLIDFNVLVRLDDHGLRDRVTPLVGFEYSL